MTQFVRGDYIWFLVLWLCVPAAVVIVGALPIDDPLRILDSLLIVPLMWVAAGALSVIWISRLYARRLSHRAAFTLAVPVFILISVLLLAPAFRLHNFVHFATVKREYDRRVHATRSGAPRLLVFMWEEDPIGGEAVVYDERDDIALPKNQRPSNWSGRASENGAILDEMCSIEPVGTHYYIVGFGCYEDGK